ncbi:MAG: agmatine deiminase family protein, partial [candidate division Zixibacteria bacterium]
MIRQTSRLLASTALIMLSLGLIPVSAETSEADSLLPIGLTEDEKLRLDEIGIAHRNTAAPTGLIRNPAEWEPSVGVIIRWPLGIGLSLVADMSDDLMVTTIVSGSSQQSAAMSAYTSSGVNMANVQFLIAPTNSIWTRDYGPWFIFEDEQLAIVDPVYNRPRPLDDVIPQTLGAEWGLTVYGMNLITPGGNYMSDGLGHAMSTKLVYLENPSLTHAEVDSTILVNLGNVYTVLDYTESGGIHHLDCWAKFLNPSTILVKDVPASSYSYSLLNDRANYLSQKISAWGQPYTIVR